MPAGWAQASEVSSVYLLGVQAGIVAGGSLGGIRAEEFGVTGPFWFAFVGSAVFLALIWRQLSHVAHAEDPDDGQFDPSLA
jgi:predicted MFS family arabinose efflux permease